MPNLAQEQKDKLLTKFAGGKMCKTYGYWKFPSGQTVHHTRWSPATKPEHLWLVFEALIKKTGWWYIEEKCRWAIKGAGLPDVYDLDWFKDVICNAALAVIEQEGV